MLNMTLTEDGQRHMMEFLNSAIEHLDRQIEEPHPSDNKECLRARRDLEKVRLMLTVHLGPQLPSNAVAVRHDAPEDLPF